MVLAFPAWSNLWWSDKLWLNIRIIHLFRQPSFLAFHSSFGFRSILNPIIVLQLLQGDELIYDLLDLNDNEIPESLEVLHRGLFLSRTALARVHQTSELREPSVSARQQLSFADRGADLSPHFFADICRCYLLLDLAPLCTQEIQLARFLRHFLPETRNTWGRWRTSHLFKLQTENHNYIINNLIFLQSHFITQNFYTFYCATLYCSILHFYCKQKRTICIKCITQINYSWRYQFMIYNARQFVLVQVLCRHVFINTNFSACIATKSNEYMMCIWLIIDRLYQLQYTYINIDFKYIFFFHTHDIYVLWVEQYDA